MPRDAKPSVLSLDRVPRWDAEVDVVVAGLGAAGGCAAVEARAAGAEVLVVERASAGGGTTATAAGHLYLGGGTRVQKAVGVEDSADDMFDYLMAVTPEPDEAKIRLYCDESVAHFDWLVAQGIPFKDSFYREKHVVQPTDDCLIWSGNEKAWPYSEQARPAARGHKVQREGEQGGSLLVEVLSQRAAALGVCIEVDTGVQALVVDERGGVVGVQTRHFDDLAFLRARRGVILCTGGFSMNAEMLETYAPVLADPRIIKQGSTFDLGVGIQLGLAAGAAVQHMAGMLVTSPYYPPASMLKGLLVNRDGQRFINEDAYHGRTTAMCLQQPEGVAYHISDDACYGRPQLIGSELIDACETVAELEAVLELPEGSLQQTIADYNAGAECGEDPAFHKHPDWLQPLTNPPYAATQASLGKALYLGFTLGGLAVSVDGEVLTAAGRPVPGLYAAGACASNIAQDSHGYSSGTCIGESTFFGRRAGRAAAARDPHRAA